MNGQFDPQDIVNRLSCIKPPPPIKMRVEDYVELLNRIMQAKPAVREETLQLLMQYDKDLDDLAEKLAAKLKLLYQLK